MWVSGDGWNEDVMATPCEKSVSGSSFAVAPTMASLFVRVSSPRRGERSGSRPVSRRRCNRRCVPSAPAAKTTSVARRVDFCGKGPGRLVESLQ